MYRAILQRPLVAGGAAIAITGTLALLAAWFFQYGLGYAACGLCMEQRIPYYFAIPIAILLSVAAAKRAPHPLLIAGFALLGAIMLINVGLAVYHAGIEWKWWAGPPECSAQITAFGSPSDLLKGLNSHIPRCDQAPWRFLGLSFAGYNVLISLGLTLVAALAILLDRTMPASKV
jgi:disulfide bond formation protein DsbB